MSDTTVEDAKKRDRCETCRFYQPHETWKGLCRRMPPKMVKVTRCGNSGWTETMEIGFPDTGWSNWCGEWRGIDPPKGDNIA